MKAAVNDSDTAARFAQSISALPPLPATAQKILTCFGDEFIDAEKVADVVEGDPGICAKLLGLANSAYFGLAEPVRNMEEAISRVLGVDTVRSLVLAMAIQSSFKSKDCPAFNVERFWTQSLKVAECCKKIVAADAQAGDEDRDLAYSAGLCHNLGLMALSFLEPEKINAVLLRKGSDNAADALSGMFLEEFGTDYKIMTAELARTWSLPEPMLSAYQFQAFPSSHSDVRLAYVLVASIIATDNVCREPDEQFSLEASSEALGIEADELQAMAEVGERAEERVQSLASNMSH